MNKYLFLFTIGSVQSFISQARKTHDLYAGSSIFSYLVDYAINTLKNKLGDDFELIIPSPSLCTESKPNELLSMISCDNIAGVGSWLKKEVEKKFCEIVETAFINSGLKRKPGNYCKQLTDFPNTYWGAVLFDENGNNLEYMNKYKQLTKLIRSVKNTRAFAQLMEAGKKCSLCGERNALIYRPSIDKNGNERIPMYIDTNSAVKTDDVRFNPGEGVCAVCFAKRYFLKEKKNSMEEFPSTAEISLSYLLNEVRKDCEGEKALEEYKNLFSKHPNFDEQLYYSENLTEKYFKKYGFDINILNKVKEQNNVLIKYIEELNKNLGKNLGFSKYYAVINIDGDDMGRWLSGECLREDMNLKEFHKELSQKLGTFAEFAQRYLDSEKRGRCVYAGGEDLLGFVNLHYLFDVMSELRNYFNENVNLPIKEKYFKQEFIEENKNITLSAGVVIAHYKTPLYEVLRKARQAINIAKEKSNEKDSFCIAVLKRSGEFENAVCKWDLNGLEAAPAIKRIINDHLNNGFSNSFIKRLSSEMYSLMGSEGIFSTRMGLENRIIETEIKRLVERSCIMRKGKDEKEEEHRQAKRMAIMELTKTLSALYKMSSEIHNKDYKIKNFVSLLNILDFIERKR